MFHENRIPFEILNETRVDKIEQVFSMFSLFLLHHLLSQTHTLMHARTHGGCWTYSSTRRSYKIRIPYNNPKNPIKHFELSDASCLGGIIPVATISKKFL